MKSYFGLLILLTCSFISIQPMEQDRPHVQKLPEDASDFQKLPMDMKLYIIKTIIEGPSIITAFDQLKRLRLVNKEFNKIVKNLELPAKEQGIWPSLRPFFEFLEVVKSDNIFTILNFLKEEPNRKLLSYQDLAEFIQSKFYYRPFENRQEKIFYLPLNAIQAGLDLCNPILFGQFKDSVTDIQKELGSALSRNDLARIVELLFIGADPNSITIPPGISLLKFILINFPDKYTIIKLFLDKRAKIEPGDLSEAIKYNKIDIAELLLKYGANPNDFVDEKDNAQAKSPLEVAFGMRDIAMLELLIEYHARININLSNGFTPLLNAAYFKNTTIINLLLDAGANTADNYLQKQFDSIEEKKSRVERTRWDEAYHFMIQAIELYKVKVAQKELEDEEIEDR